MLFENIQKAIVHAFQIAKEEKMLIIDSPCTEIVYPISELITLQIPNGAKSITQNTWNSSMLSPPSKVKTSGEVL